MMDRLAIEQQRLYNQGISPVRFEQPDQVLAWFGAMQAQNYAGVLWAIGLRCKNATVDTVEQAIASKQIVRTWLMRGTLQIAAAKDLRWMIRLLAPRLIANSQHRYQQLELDADTFSHSTNALTNALQERSPLTRSAMMAALEQAGISTEGQRGYHLLGYAALEGLICFGPMQAKQQTFVLLEEWLPASQPLTKDEALAELATRYFQSHGPATLQDFGWWSGLRVGEARTGLEMIEAKLQKATFSGEEYWLPQAPIVPSKPSPDVCLLPAFDEYYLGYKNRDAILAIGEKKQVVSSNGVFRPIIVINGQVVGIWKHAVTKKAITISLNPFASLTDDEKKAILNVAQAFGVYLNLDLPVVIDSPDLG